MRESRIVLAFVIAVILVSVTAVIAAFQIHGRIDDGAKQNIDRTQLIDEDELGIEIENQDYQARI
ncbi:MAG TPA: hypothetical protein VNK96_06090 [Fimbriimonadales bacterium]|nr:hypothetical protein [Fimbriimonadales bacterium]